MEELDTSRPFRRGTALSAGITAKRLRGPSFQRVLPGILLRSDVAITPVRRAQAALATIDGPAHASHVSAARVLGIPVPTIPDEYVTVSTPAARRSTTGVRYVVRADTEAITVDGLRVSTPAQVFDELAGLLSLVDLVVVGDHLVRRHAVSCHQLIARAARIPGRPGKNAQRAAAYVRPRVDSPMETRLRMLLGLAGIPEPETNWEIRDSRGELLRRHDLAWPPARVIAEYDGRLHIEREQRWERDLERREASDADEWRTITVVARGIYRTPGDTVRRVFDALRDRGLDGLPARPSTDWQPHFPGEQ